MKECASCGKQFTPTHKHQKYCNTCRSRTAEKRAEAGKKRREAVELKKKYGTGTGSHWKCNIFPDCDKCPFDDCKDWSDRIYGKELIDG